MAGAGRLAGAAAVVLGALLFGFAAFPAAGIEPDPAPFVAARTATIQVFERYAALRSLDDRRRPVDTRVGLPTVTLPFASVLEALLRHAGIAVLREPGAAADLRISVDCHGTTTGQLYDAAVRGQRIRELRYTDATIGGALRLEAGGAVLTRGFDGQIDPPMTIIGIVDGGDVRRDPNYAPFRAAFEAPRGLLDVAGSLVLEIWGEAPLRAALNDRDPLVRDAARRALDSGE